jgi:hypothetical protein
LIYTVECGSIYAGKDIRYAATAWIRDNIGQDRRIVIPGHSEWVVHNDIFKDHDISIINNEPGGFNQKFNKRFVGGRQFLLSKEDVGRIAKTLEGEHDYYIVYPVNSVPDRFDFLKINEVANNSGIGLAGQKKVVEFSRGKYSFWWRPKIDGYEPRRIIITCGRA